MSQLTTYHVTTRERALEILAHGFTEQDVFFLTILSGVRLLSHPSLNNWPSLRFIVDGQQLDAPDMGPPWEPFLVNRIHDPVGNAVLEVTLPDDIRLDDFRYEEAVTLWNRETQETRETDLFHWTGEWLVPLPLVQRGQLRLLEQELDEENEELLRQTLVKLRAFWTEQEVPPDEIERRLTDMENDVRAFQGEEEPPGK